jgi:hypothetical protein
VIYINGLLTAGGGLHWQWWPGTPSDGLEPAVRLGFHISGSSKVQRREAVVAVQDRIETCALDWLVPGRKREWILDCDGLRAVFEVLENQDWLKGKIQIEPEWEDDQREVFDTTTYEGSLVFYVTPEIVKEARIMARGTGIATEIAESLDCFITDYPDPSKAAFIMMRFGTTSAHDEIVTAVKSVLDARGITGLRADDRQYHDDLFYNILTYMYGCGFGIAVFERLESDDFNPNVSLELGYMLALPKPVCLLKDSTLRTLPTDLMGKLYKSFDPQHPAKTIASELEHWLNDKGF